MANQERGQPRFDVNSRKANGGYGSLFQFNLFIISSVPSYAMVRGFCKTTGRIFSALLQKNSTGSIWHKKGIYKDVAGALLGQVKRQWIPVTESCFHLIRRKEA